MLRALQRLLMPRAKQPIVRIAFWTKRELSDVRDELAHIFDADALHRDYENEWEWLEGVSRRGFAINICRTHDWSHGDHDLPVLVDLTRDGARLDLTEIRSWASAIAAHFGCDVSIGDVSHGDDRNYRLSAHETIRGKTEG